MTDKRRIAFIGLGNMGGPMATNLVRAGHDVCVFDLQAEAVAQLEEAGARSADDAATAAQSAEFVISMLPAGKHVASVYLGEDGLLAGLTTGTVVIDSSTIDAETARRVAKAASQRGIAMLDAPVSGGVAAAAAGTLSFMCGGDADTFERAKPVLASMGKNLFLAGDHGAGQVAKMCNNMLLAVHMIGTAEALQMGVNNGLDAAVLSDIMLASSGRNWSLEVYNPFPGVMPGVPSSNEYKPGFMGQLMEKDLGLALDNSRASGSQVPMGEQALALYQRYNAEGHAQEDFSGIIRLLAKAED